VLVQRSIGKSALRVSNDAGVVIGKRVRVPHTRILSRVTIWQNGLTNGKTD
jgi:hypothetical protein